MRTYNKTLIGVALTTLGLAGCLESGGPAGNANTQPDIETSGPTAIEEGPHPVFKPLDSQFPLPSDALLFLSEEEDGTMLNGNFVDPESPDYNPVTAGIGYLDGNSVLEPFDIRISDSIDPETLDARDFIERDDEVIPNPEQSVFLIPLTQPSGDSRFPLEDEVAGISRMDRYERAQRLLDSDDEADRTEANELLQGLVAENQRIRVEVISLDGGTDNTIRILPLEPLRPNTKYAVAITNDINTQSGKALVGAPSYQTVADPERTLSNPALQPFRDATVPARRIAARYFDLKRSAISDDASIPDFEDVTFSTTFTTTGVDDVLLANAAPQTHFEERVRTSERKQALEKLLDGTYNLSGVPLDDGASDRDKAINQKLFELLSQESDSADPLLFHEEDVPLFDPALAQLLIEARDNRQKVTYQDIALDTDGSLAPDTALIAQAAAVRAVDLVRATAISDKATSLAEAAEQQLDTPKPRDVRFFSQKLGREINPSLGQSGEVLLGVEADVDIRVYEGEITLPYYGGIPADESDGSTIQNSNWTAADFGSDVDLPLAPTDRVTSEFPFVRKTGETKVPLVVTAPDTSAAFETAAGTDNTTEFPVIIYQHAATTDRSAILPMATATGLLCAQDASECFVTVGIDMPLHGIFDEGVASARDEENGVPGMININEQEGASGDAIERHFGFAAKATGEPAVPAGQLENPESGTTYLNFANFPNTAGNMHQVTMDLLNVSSSIPAIKQAITDCVNEGRCAGQQESDDFNIDPERIYFLTHSISGSGAVGFPHINNEALAAGNDNLSGIDGSAFLNTGGHFTRLLENSPSQGPTLLQGLDEQSDGLLAQGNTELNIYFNVFQSLIDSVDPSAYAGFYEGDDVLLTEIVGTPGNEDLMRDQTVPNAADANVHDIGEDFDLGPLELVTEDTGFQVDSEPAPLAGTEPLANAIGAESTPLAGSVPVITRFLEGAHGNPVSAGQEEAEAGSSTPVFNEMALQTMELFSNGTVNTNSCVVKDTGDDCSEPSSDGSGGDGGTDGGDDGGLIDFL
ncbi:hypothetical protein DES49_2355 [Halospina denitrificans]|uniref:Virulence factor lipase-like protein n=1 Tax=Halospina denitrificans TaxID=332522 RepID=A0A4R7JMX7_9GAMM|nr:hypothetical protein [Halospina denitrificans]TDT39430.1 hypothetical protein DES49_2355 [Halospina denitrificans]